MAKSRSFSIYLLKPGYGPKNALKKDHGLDPAKVSGPASAEWTVFLAKSDPKQPWWKQYFGIEDSLNQSVQGALAFVSVQGRTFALSFGPGHFALAEDSYEYDFGLKTTLNCVDPVLIRNTDVLDPGSSRRRRTQVAARSDITYFDFDGDNSVLRSLTGSIREEYKDLFTHATGSSSLRVSSDQSVSEITDLLLKLLDIYGKDTYKTAFPGIDNITPVRDPKLIAALDKKLTKAIGIGDEDVFLSVPALIDFNDDFWIGYAGAGKSSMYPDVRMEDYLDYLASQKKVLKDLQVDDLRRHELCLLSDAGVVRARYSIYKSLTFETKHGKGSATYHLSEANWYRVEDNFLRELTAFLDPYCVDLWLPPCQEKPEAAYNKSAVKVRAGALCLDATSIAPPKQRQVEPCDILSIQQSQVVLTHVKIGTSSSTLSHLFNQGTNAVELLRGNQDARDRLRHLVSTKSSSDTSEIILGVKSKSFCVEFAIITKKDPAAMSANLPLFSRISLRRALQSLEVMGVPATYGFVMDSAPAAAPKAKKRKQTAKSKLKSKESVG